MFAHPRTQSSVCLAAIAVCPLLAFGATAARAQAAGTIAGRVVSAEKGALVGVFISVDSASPSAQTDGDGRFTVGGLAAGRHVLQARRTGFGMAERAVEVRADDTTRVEITLTPTVATLAAVTVIGSRTDLAETQARIGRV